MPPSPPRASSFPTAWPATVVLLQLISKCKLSVLSYAATFVTPAWWNAPASCLRPAGIPTCVLALLPLFYPIFHAYLASCELSMRAVCSQLPLFYPIFHAHLASCELSMHALNMPIAPPCRANSEPRWLTHITRQVSCTDTNLHLPFDVSCLANPMPSPAHEVHSFDMQATSGSQLAAFFLLRDHHIMFYEQST